MLSKIQINIIGISVDNLSLLEVVSNVKKSIQHNQQIHVEGVNASKIVDMQYDKLLHDSVTGSSLITPDGQSVVWASKILGNPLKERVAGIDLMRELVALAGENQYKIYLLGAKPQVVESVATGIQKNHSPNIIAG